ncbi:hypothetical protein HPB52_006434 [Rhipicephalus sanguineus]|uniref:Uncharacterized protein n=1 Tax=Rhipicephalus sanguineus TaxID=34632 RepID=A0A9D4Q5V7_RHISA|nr:hypothetical protein HPB52_006434 [Rhipicephalus sanguineus]
MLAMVRQVADRCGEQRRESAIVDGVECLKRCSAVNTMKKPPLEKVSSTLKDRGIVLLQADKEGGFAVLPKTLFKEKAMRTMEKNLKPVEFDPKKQKRRALKFLDDLNLVNLALQAKKEEKGFLGVFFSVKTH